MENNAVREMLHLFGKTTKQWRDENSDKNGNIRDYAGINELICLSNMENKNAFLMEDRLSQQERFVLIPPNSGKLKIVSIKYRDVFPHPACWYSQGESNP